MAARAALAVLLAAWASAWPRTAVAGHAAGGDGRTAMLTRATFDGYLEEERKKQQPCIVMFHVSWCKVCQRTFPKFAAASDLVFEKGVKMDFAHVDCTDDKSLCQRFGVKGYPTIKFFPPRDGKEPLNYRSPRTEEAFLHYAERMTRPAVLAPTGAAALAEVLRGEALAGFVAAGASSGPPPAGLAVAAERWQDLHIFAMGPSLQELLPQGVTPPSGASLAVISQGEQQWPGADNATQPKPAAAFYRGSLDDEEAVNKWVERNRFPGIWTLDSSNFYFFTHASRRTALVALDPANVAAEHEAALRGAAAALADEFAFGVVDGVAWAEELTDFGIAKSDLPRVLVTEDDFDAWVEDADALRMESLERDLRSLSAGAPLLRQNRSMWSKLFYYRRQAFRYAVRARTYAMKGPGEAAAVCASGVVGLALVAAFGWCVMSCCKALLANDPEFDCRPEGSQKKHQ